MLGAVGCSDESALLVADALTLRSIALQTGLLRKAQSVPVVETSRATSATLVHYGAVRSGQQLYAEGGSLVVVGSVNEGGEVMADGDIHVSVARSIVSVLQNNLHLTQIKLRLIPW